MEQNEAISRSSHVDSQANLLSNISVNIYSQLEQSAANSLLVSQLYVWW